MKSLRLAILIVFCGILVGGSTFGANGLVSPPTGSGAIQVQAVVPPGAPPRTQGPSPADMGNALPANGSAVNLSGPAAPPQHPPGATQQLQQAIQQALQTQMGEVLLFGLVCLVLQAYLLARVSASAEAILRNMTVTLVVTLSIAVVMLGFPNEITSPIIGLFGTIIGFLLGQQVRSSETASGSSGQPSGPATPVQPAGPVVPNGDPAPVRPAAAG